MNRAKLPRQVTIVEVGPRDGLQNERTPIPTEIKLAFISALADAGIKHIEATSFVHPKAIPQLADAVEVARGLPTESSVTYSALVPNEKGLDRAIEAGIRRIAVFTAASETFARKNINMSIDESLASFGPLIKRAKSAGMSVRGYLSTCFECPYEGWIPPEMPIALSQDLLELGVDQVAISDTIGAAAPSDVNLVLAPLLAKVPPDQIALHFHDTYGTALANVCEGLEMGITTFDASAGGLGGCPYAPGASGNLATEDLVYLLERMGISTGVSLEKLAAATQPIASLLGHELPGRNLRRLRNASAT